jgi:Uma2 family endonuclease
MITRILPVIEDEEIDYPDSDGRPMAENTLQFQWIVTIEGGLDSMFWDRQDVFVAGDLLWYPVRGNNTLRMAPDSLVVFGRPKGHRGSYMQWREENIAPQVVWEVLSPGNRKRELQEKFDFYEKYGVEEYYQYDPDRIRLRGWLRSGERLEEIKDMQGWKSPRTGIILKIANGQLVIERPDGQRFLSYLELDEARRTAREEAIRNRREKEAAKTRARSAKQEAEAAKAEAKLSKERAELLAAKLREMGVDPDA